MDDNKIKEFVRALIKLTKLDKVRWENFLANINSCVYEDSKGNDWRISVDWCQDDKPALCIDGYCIQGYDCGIQELLQEIDNQYKRHQLYSWSQSSINTLKQSEEVGNEQYRKFGELSTEFLEDPEVKKILRKNRR